MPAARSPEPSRSTCNDATGRFRGVRFRDGIDALRYIDTVRYNVFRSRFFSVHFQ
jgi:hypothetical protein